MTELINNLNSEKHVEDNHNTITANACSIELPGIGRRAYINSLTDRIDLKIDCEQTNSFGVYADVMAVWGDTPTVKDDVIPKPSFAELKITKIDELSLSFADRTHGTITTTQGYVMQFDTTDSLKMQGAITLMEAVGSTVGYITQANDVTKYNIPIETMKQVLVEMLSAYAKCHARKQELRTLINNAQTEEELDGIVISWPV